MKLLFLDESGTIPPLDKIKDKYFVIGGVIIDENDWHDIHARFNDIKQKYGIQAESEIKWRYFSPTNKDESNSLKHLEQAQKYALRDELYELITSYESTKIISVVTDVEEVYKLPQINDQNDLYWRSYSKLIINFQLFLHLLSMDSGLKINGIVIIDNRLPTDDNKLRKVHHELMLSTLEDIAKLLESPMNLIEEVFIAPSHHSMGIQLADIATGAIFRKYAKNDGKCYEKIIKSLWGLERIAEDNGLIKEYGKIKIAQKKTPG